MGSIPLSDPKISRVCDHDISGLDRHIGFSGDSDVAIDDEEGEGGSVDINDKVPACIKEISDQCMMTKILSTLTHR